MWNEYKASILDAVMWTQVVEMTVRDCLLIAIANGRIKRDASQTYEIKKKKSLYGLACDLSGIDKDLAERLKSFASDRNELMHNVAGEYIIDVLAGEEEHNVRQKMYKCTALKQLAGNFYGELLDMHTTLTR